MAIANQRGIDERQVLDWTWRRVLYTYYVISTERAWWAGIFGMMDFDSPGSSSGLPSGGHRRGRGLPSWYRTRPGRQYQVAHVDDPLDHIFGTMHMRPQQKPQAIQNIRPSN